MSDELENIIEAVLLASDSAVSVARIQSLFEAQARPQAARVNAAIAALQAGCAARGIELKKIGNGFRYQTRPKYADYLRRLYAVKPPRMSRALLETLAIVAFRQPVSRGDIEEIRGVAVSTEIMQRLIEREWIKPVGVRAVPGRPALYATTDQFLAYFNLSSLQELPALMAERDLLAIADEMETPLPSEVMTSLHSKLEQDDKADNAANNG